MACSVASEISTQDFYFENTRVRIIANRSLPEINLIGLSLGPFEEGNEYEVYYWIAKDLERAGVTRFTEEEPLDGTRLSKIHWSERIQTVGQVSKLPVGFYPKIRRYISELNEQIGRDAGKMREYERVRHLMQDIVNSRLRKIISIASAPAQSENTLRNLTPEERCIHQRLCSLINQWRTEITEYEGERSWEKKNSR